MEHPAQPRFQLTSNQLKLIALVAMTIDHVGMILLPRYIIFRIIGRLAFPIFSFMIAEGCRHTSHPARYLGSVFAVGAVLQIIRLIAIQSLYQSILITFSLSIVLIYSIQWAQKQPGLRWVVCAFIFLLIAFVCEGLPRLLPGTDFAIDYGFSGVLVPVFVFLGTTYLERMTGAAIGLLFVSMHTGGVQWFGFASLLLLACYHGKRGTMNLKYLFYIYYPLHLVVIRCIGMLILGS